jgi:hypothetical protein
MRTTRSSGLGYTKRYNCSTNPVATIEQIEVRSPRPHAARLLKTHSWIHPVVILSVMAAFLFLERHNIDWRTQSASLLGIALVLVFIIPAIQSAMVTMLGLTLPRRKEDDLRFAPDLRPLRRLHICVVSKGVNQEALRRTYEKIRPLIDERMRLDLVTDLPVDLPHIRVPADFTTKHARFKARALEYYRQLMNFSKDDWILHLDEETIVDEESLEACILFCKRSPHLLGQGIILYNNHGYWNNRLIAVADAVRTGDDMGRFFAQLAWVNRPIFGLHGSFLLVNGAIENEITWDLKGYLVEDYAFSLPYMNGGCTCGFVDGFAREQSPITLLDFLKQRRRWIVGIRSLSYASLWPAYWATLWQMGPLARVLAVVASATHYGPWWFVLPAAFATVVNLYQYLLGMLIQDLDLGAKHRTIVWHLFQVATLYLPAIVMETSGVAWAVFTRQKNLEFYVVKK